jgi:hypothetical protein
VKSLSALAIAAALSGACALHHQGARPGRSPISEASVRSHMEFLASDALAGRGSGTRDEWIAAAYTAAQMRRFGLEPAGDDGGFVQRIGIERRTAAAPPELTSSGGRFTHGEQMLVLMMGAPASVGPLFKLQPNADNVPPGAVVLMPRDAPMPTPPSANGATLQLRLETPPARGLWATAGARLPQVPPRLVGETAHTPARATVIVLDRAAYDAVAALADGAPIGFNAELKAAETTSTWNAVGRLSGTDPKLKDEIILLSAHLDHVGTRTPPASASAGADTIYNGADDDASGTAAVLELAHALALGSKPKRTIVFALFGSEESGGFGSRFFADRPPAPLHTIVANLQFEMIGRPDPKVAAQTLWLTGFERSDLGPTLAKHGARLVRDPHPEQNFFMRSDNYQFARRGIIAHTVSSYGMHTDYHQPSDEVRTIDFLHMTRAIASMLEPIRWLANSSFKPEWLPGMKP